MSASLKHNFIHSNRMIHGIFKNRFIWIIWKNRFRWTRIGHHVLFAFREWSLRDLSVYTPRLPEKSGLIYQDSETEAVPASPSFIDETGSRVTINDFWWKKPSDRAYGGYSCVFQIDLWHTLHPRRNHRSERAVDTLQINAAAFAWDADSLKRDPRFHHWPSAKILIGTSCGNFNSGNVRICTNYTHNRGQQRCKMHFCIPHSAGAQHVSPAWILLTHGMHFNRLYQAKIRSPITIASVFSI